MLEINKIHLGDSYELIKQIPDKSIDLVIIDPPYGINADKGVGGDNLGKVRKYQGGWDSATPLKCFFNLTSLSSIDTDSDNICPIVACTSVRLVTVKTSW